MNRKYLLAGAAMLLSVLPAFGGAGTITVKDASSANKVFDVVTDGSGNFISESVICDQSAAATCASVGTAGSPSTNALTVQPVTIGNGTSANAARVTLSNDSTGQVALAAGAAVVGAVTQSGNWTTRVVGNAGAIVDFAGQNASSPANSILMGGQFNTSPTTITSGNSSPLQMDNAGNLLVNIKAGAGSGGTALADEGTFTQGTTNFTPVGCLFNNSVANLTSGQGGAFNCSNDRRLQTISRLLGNAGAILDGATGAAVPANVVYLGVNNGGNLLGWPAKTANTVANTDVVPEVAVANALASVNDNSDSVAVATPFGTPVVNHNYAFDGTNWNRVLAKAASTRPAATDRAQIVNLSPNPPTYCSSPLAINQTTSTDVHTFTNDIFICAVTLVSATQQQVSIVYGTGSTCGTGTNALWGSTTAGASNGMPLAANGGFSPSFNPPVAVLTGAQHLCILQSGSGLLSGVIWYADAA